LRCAQKRLERVCKSQRRDEVVKSLLLEKVKFKWENVCRRASSWRRSSGPCLDDSHAPASTRTHRQTCLPGLDLGWGPRGPPTNSIHHSTRDAPKLAFLSSKIEKFSGEGAQPHTQTSPRGEGGTPPHTLPHQRLRRLDPRDYGARPRPQGRLPRVLWAPSDAPVTEIDP